MHVYAHIYQFNYLFFYKKIWYNFCCYLSSDQLRWNFIWCLLLTFLNSLLSLKEARGYFLLICSLVNMDPCQFELKSSLLLLFTNKVTCIRQMWIMWWCCINKVISRKLFTDLLKPSLLLFTNLRCWFETIYKALPLTST